MITEILVAFAVIAIIKLHFYKHKNNTKRGQNGLPPGPWGFPIMGHLPLLGKNPALKFLEWKKVYGPIFSVKFGSIPVVVLNDVKIIKDAFNQDSFSGRPPLNNWVEMTGCKGIAFTTAGPRQLEQRKFAIKSFKEFEGVGKSAMEYRVEGEMSIFLSNLGSKCCEKVSSSNFNSEKTQLTTKIQIKNFFQLPIINSFWDAIMGQRFDEKDPTITNFMTIFEKLGDTSSSLAANLSWFFPWVSKLLCVFGLNPVVSGMRQVYSRMEELIEDQNLDHVPGHPKHYTHAYFDQIAIAKDTHSSFHMSRNEQAISTGDLFLGAVDTTTVTLDWLLLYMAREPEVQRKLLNEIDAVMGSAAATGHNNVETPSLSHRIKMPFTDAVIHEVTRIATLTPLGLFHLTLEDIPDFHGFAIPKDTMVIANLQGVHNDPEIWSEPNKFLPERFLNSSLVRSASLTGNLLPFSFGKRSCVGEGFARDQIFLIITSFFQKFKISADKVPSAEGHFGVVFAPPPFKINITKR